MQILSYIGCQWHYDANSMPNSCKSPQELPTLKGITTYDYKLAKIKWLKSNKKAGQMDKNFHGTFKPSLSETEMYNPQENQILKKAYSAQY